MMQAHDIHMVIRCSNSRRVKCRNCLFFACLLVSDRYQNISRHHR